MTRNQTSFRPERFNFHVLGVLMILLFAVQAGEAQALAVICKDETAPILFDYPKNLNVTPNIPDGTVLFRRDMEVVAKCGVDTPFKSERVYLHRKNLVDILGPGLSVFLTYRGVEGNTEALFDTRRDVSAYSVGGVLYDEVKIPITLEIRKTKMDTIPSTPPARKYETLFTLSGMYEGSKVARFMVESGNIGYLGKTCRVDRSNIDVRLGNITTNSKSGLGSGINSKSPPVAFEIPVSCSTDVAGKFNVDIALGGIAVPGFSGTVLALSSSSDASGLGIEISRGDTQTPVVLGQRWTIGSYPDVLETIVVPLSGRYIQTENTISSGAANAVATIDLTYL